MIVLADAADAEAEAVATALGAPVLPPDRALDARAARTLLLFAPPDRWRGVVLRLAGLHPRVLVVAPRGAPAPLPAGSRAIARFVLPSAEEARAWGAHIPLGRLAVARPGDAVAWRTVIAEVEAQHRRGGRVG